MATIDLENKSSNSSLDLTENLPSTSDQSPWQMVYKNERENTEQHQQDILGWNIDKNAFELSKLMESEREKLQKNEEMRAEMWSKFIPFLTLALFLYIMLSIIWIVYNFTVYRRQKLKSLEHAKISWNSRLLRVYEEMPTDSTSTTSNISTEIVVPNPEHDDRTFTASSDTA
uniref:Uncharacterized protein n=1 Tax=Ditylenchus dipsaci TaxID=166011 RepID=A0A915E4F9_9BILA